MAVRETMTVSLTPELRAFVQERLKSGRYGNASEVVRAALRLLGEHEPDLRSQHPVPTLHPRAR
ncbi:type II toxin-antitoxin system ParD family antitoxin [Methylobacterium sp. Leaf117]|uniref:type II toxin-antitoxin system ParD family antitoxin n=1 Tax=Methylobacterium sp. Leaf117 TaxID=1736260 RepID=UPI0019101ECA